MLAFGCAKSTGTTAARLSALGDAGLDVVELDVVSVVGLDIGGETVEGALDGLLGGAVHHAGLWYVSSCAVLVWNHDSRIAAHHRGSTR